MRTPSEALDAILREARQVGPLRAERVPLADALGRALAAAVRAPASLPPFAAATMDGYALRSADATEPGARLAVAFTVAAGHPASGPLPRGACCRIFTGAPLPRGADAVEMQERVVRRGAMAVFERSAEAGRFVRAAGSDVMRGAVALPAGALVDPGAIGLAAALGLSTLPVRRRPRVAILPTGDEVVALGGRRRPGQIVDSNAHALAAAVLEAGGLPTVLPVARDDLDALRRDLRRGRAFDVLVTSGGVSVGDRDLVRAALAAEGARLHFWRVAMRPGKPVAFGRWGRRLVFGLPGNPTSALVTFELFARPALRALAGLPGLGRTVARGRLAADQVKPAGLTVFLRTRAALRGGVLWFEPLRSQVSGDLTSAVGVTALAILPAGRSSLRAGTPVEAILLRPPGPENG